MPNCTHCHQPQTAALVIYPECYRAMERTVSMETDKLIEALRKGCPVVECARCDYSGESDCNCNMGPTAADCIEKLTAQLEEQAAEVRRWKDLYESMERTWNRTEVELTEKDKQLSNARNELCQQCGKYRMAHKGACDGCRWRGPQEAGEVEHEQQ